MSVSVPAQALADARAADSDLWPVLLAIAGPESGYNPRAVGDQGCSKGYLQFNQCGGLGAGHSDSELLDGVSNFRLGAQYIRGRLNAGAGLYDALSPWSTRGAAWALYQRMQSEGIEGAGSVPAVGGSGPNWLLVGIAAVIVLALLS